MARIWSRPIEVSDLDGPDYWDYFGTRLVDHAVITPGAKVLDVGCGTYPFRRVSRMMSSTTYKQPEIPQHLFSAPPRKALQLQPDCLEGM